MLSKGSNHRPKEDHLNAHLAQTLTEQLRIKVLKTKEAVNLDLKQSQTKAHRRKRKRPTRLLVLELSINKQSHRILNMESNTIGLTIS
jgi:ethanolamine utilization protein EutQ (cupin superfamily)